LAKRGKMRTLFGTDGIRGVANVSPMTGEMAMKIGKATAHLFKNHKRRPKIVIGKDTRLSGYMFETALASGICSMGVDVLLVGPLPTPGIAFITYSMRADAGVVISASHNPFEDNGIKIFSGDGFKLPDALEKRIEELIFSEKIDSFRSSPAEIGKAYRIDDAIGRYVVFLKNSFPKEKKLDGIKIVLDCANGAAYKVAPAVFEELGAEVDAVSVSPDGVNINKNCGALYPEFISSIVKEKNADIGIALDGDGDRAVFVDESGNIVDGDHIMAICALDMIKKEKLKENTLVTTIMSNMGLDKAIKNAGGKIIKTQVGDRYVVEEMLKGGYNLGGEQSGHIIFLDYNTTGDGIITALQVLNIMLESNKPLSELSKVMTPYPQVLLNVPVKEKKNFYDIPQINDSIESAKDSLNSKGRVLIRYSGTEPLVRIMVEGEDKKSINHIANQLANIFREFLN